MGTEYKKKYAKYTQTSKESEYVKFSVLEWCKQKIKDNLVWNTAFMICLAMLMFQVSQCLDKLVSPGIRSQIKRATDNFPALPAFVFCYNMPYDLERLKSVGITINRSGGPKSIWARRNPRHWNFSNFNTSAMTLTQLWNHVTANFTVTPSNEIKRIMQRDTHYHMMFGRCESWKPINDTSGSSIPFATFGFSFSIDKKYKGYWSREDIPDKGVYTHLNTFVEYMEAFQVVLFDYRTEWNEFSFSSRFKENLFVNLDEDVVAKLQMNEYWLANSNRQPCETNESYSQVACEYECVRRSCQNHYNCTVPFLTPMKYQMGNASIPECKTVESIHKIIRGTFKLLHTSAPPACALNCMQRCQFRTYRAYVEYRKPSGCDVIPHFDNIETYNMRMPTVEDNMLNSSIIFYFNAGYTRRINEELAYDTAQFVAEIGGSVGLFLGLSVLGLTHLLQDSFKVLKYAWNKVR